MSSGAAGTLCCALSAPAQAKVAAVRIPKRTLPAGRMIAITFSKLGLLETQIGPLDAHAYTPESTSEEQDSCRTPGVAQTAADHSRLCRLMDEGGPRTIGRAQYRGGDPILKPQVPGSSPGLGSRFSIVVVYRLTVSDSPNNIFRRHRPERCVRAKWTLSVYEAPQEATPTIPGPAGSNCWVRDWSQQWP